MDEPWNIKPQDTRLSDTLVTFIIFCEDEVSEPLYFKFFETSNIKVNPIKNQKSKMDNVLHAICHCHDQGFMESKEGLLYFHQEDTQVWCVFDRDIEENTLHRPAGNVNFNEAIETANSRGINVAWSNDSFELWVLLHFEDVDLGNEGYQNRNTYYARLTEIFKSIPDPNEDLKKALAHGTFSYRQDLKHESNFRYIVRDLIIVNTNDAIARARVLEKHYDLSPRQNHEKSPCTLVHHLVEELIQHGGKVI